MYKFYARVNHAEVREHLLRPDFSLDATPLLEDGAKLMAVCQPNNPTANLFDPGELSGVSGDPGGIDLVDEAYADFSGSDMLKDAMSSESCIDTRTFSKAYGIAGLRVGFAVSRKDVIGELRRVRTPFGLNSFSEAVAISALDNKGWVRDSVSRMRSDRDYLSSRMRALGFDVKPSVCNFVIGRSPVDGPGLVAALRSKGVAVRDCSTVPDARRIHQGDRRPQAAARPLPRGSGGDHRRRPRMNVTIMDYGVGNLHSLSKGLERAGASTEVVSDPVELLGAECIVFPGVGAFGAAAAAIAPVMDGLRARIGSGTPALGICLGMQLMFERSEESPGAGLSAFDGDVRRRVLGPRVPHMGWNEVVSSGRRPLRWRRGRGEVLLRELLRLPTRGRMSE